MNKSPDTLEVEVKFHIQHPEKMLARLIALDGKASPKVFESNLRFEDNDHSLKANNQLLRLRRDNQCRLTYKCKPDRIESQCKVYRELEVGVSDFDAMRSLLMALGYHTAQIYEKWRQTFHWHGVEICLDTLPYGTFLEIEGAQERIIQTARHLALPWDNRILTNYLAMFESLRSHYNLPFHDVTFENFQSHPADIEPLLKTFEAGPT